MRLLILSLFLCAALSYSASAQILDMAENNDRFGSAMTSGDFDGDGAFDLAIGAYNEGYGSLISAGGVNVIYGVPGAGLSEDRSQFFNQDSPGIDSEAESFDYFGYVLSNGDYNNDGYDDLAIGVHFETTSSVREVAVHILFGSRTGLDGSGSQFITIEVGSNGDIIEGIIGLSLATGDFNNDDFDDLAVGTPFDNAGVTSVVGAVHVLEGSDTGLDVDGAEKWVHDTLGLADRADPGDRFGWDVEAGDFDGDSFDDLAIGAVRDEIDPLIAFSIGVAYVIYGSDQGLDATNYQTWTQDDIANDPAESNDQFATRLAAGNFNNDTFDDLAISSTREELGGFASAGAVNVIYGTADGLAADDGQFFSQNTPGVESDAEESDFFGVSLASGDFNGDRIDDLAIGVSGEELMGFEFAGGVQILQGSSDGLSTDNSSFWTQNSPGIADELEERDFFGSAVVAGDFDGDAISDLGVGASVETIDEMSGAGAVNVIYGTEKGLARNRNQFFYQGSSLDVPVSIELESGIPASPHLLISSYPNPFSHQATVTVGLSVPKVVEIALYDILGRRVRTFHAGILPAGEHTLHLDGALLPAGTYFVRAATDTATRTKYLVRVP